MVNAFTSVPIGDGRRVWNPAAIRTERVRRQWTQEDLAERADVTQPRISDWETGKARPEFESIEKLARAFDVPAFELFEKIYRPAEAA